MWMVLMMPMIALGMCHWQCCGNYVSHYVWRHSSLDLSLDYFLLGEIVFEDLLRRQTGHRG